MRLESGAIEVRERRRKKRERRLFLLHHHQLCHATQYSLSTFSFSCDSWELNFWRMFLCPDITSLAWVSLSLAVRIRQWPTSLTLVVSLTSHLNKRSLPPLLLSSSVDPLSVLETKEKQIEPNFKPTWHSFSVPKFCILTLS